VGGWLLELKLFPVPFGSLLFPCNLKSSERRDKLFWAMQGKGEEGEKKKRKKGKKAFGQNSEMFS